MSQLFDKIKVGTSKRSTFDLSHHQVTTSDFGYLVPICYRDMVPNDDFVVTPNIFCRLSPLAVPVYGRITCRVHHFFVPYRILFPSWNAFITQDRNNNEIPPYFEFGYLQQALATDPQMTGETGTTIPRGKYARLMANLGLNPSIIGDARDQGFDESERFSALPFLAYYRIWLDYFMDSSIYDHPAMVAAFENDIKSGGRIQNGAYLETRCCCFKKDYYTTAKLNPQDGNPSVVGVDVASRDLNPLLVPGNSAGTLSMSVGGRVYNSSAPGSVSNATTKIGQFTIEALRAADSLQRYLERNNFVGSKTINRILAHFGISPTPERLDMAEFIDGSSFPIQIGDVTSHSADGFNTTAGLGVQAGKGVGAGSGSARYHAKEHGIFMSLMSILPDTAYYQGISRHWQKGVYGDALDFFHPEFENLGYQEILNKEVYVPTPTEYYGYDEYNPDGIFGYSPRYSEYKFHNDILGGDMVGALIGSQGAMESSPDTWHLFRKLSYDNDNPLALNANFVECDNHNNDFDRVFQYQSNQYDHFYFNIDCDVKATRPMDGFTAPTLENNNFGDGNSINLPYGGTRL